MTTRPIAILKAGPRSTRVLVRVGPDDVLKAILSPPPVTAHPRALTTFLEGLALWHQARLHVVISAADLAAWYQHGLVDDLYGSIDSVHYTVDVRYPHADRPQRIEGLGDFRDLRQLALGVLR